MRRSKELIEDRLGTACRHFAYPWGVGSPAADAVARRLFDTAAIDGWRTNRWGAIDPHRLGRTPILRSDGTVFFRVKVRGMLDSERHALPSRRDGVRGGSDDPDRPCRHDRSDASVHPAAPAAAAPRRGVRRHRDQRARASTSRRWRRRDPAHRAPQREPSLGPVADARMAAELYGIFRRERFHLVHTHNPETGRDRPPDRPGSRRPGGRQHRPRLLRHARTTGSTPSSRDGSRALAARFSDLEFFQSKEDLEWALPERRRPSVAVRAISGNGIDLRRFSPPRRRSPAPLELRAELGSRTDAPVVGTVGRLVAEKGLRELLEAADRVRARFPDVRSSSRSGPQTTCKADAMAASPRSTASSCARGSGPTSRTSWP